MNHMTAGDLIRALGDMPEDELVTVRVQINREGYSTLRVVQGVESVGGQAQLLFVNDADMIVEPTIHVGTH